MALDEIAQVSKKATITQIKTKNGIRKVNKVLTLLTDSSFEYSNITKTGKLFKNQTEGYKYLWEKSFGIINGEYAPSDPDDYGVSKKYYPNLPAFVMSKVETFIYSGVRHSYSAVGKTSDVLTGKIKLSYYHY